MKGIRYTAEFKAEALKQNTIGHCFYEGIKP